MGIPLVAEPVPNSYSLSTSQASELFFVDSWFEQHLTTIDTGTEEPIGNAKVWGQVPDMSIEI